MIYIIYREPHQTGYPANRSIDRNFIVRGSGYKFNISKTANEEYQRFFFTKILYETCCYQNSR